MSEQQIAFWILSAIAVLGALVAVRKRNLVHGVFALMLFFAALSGLFLLLLAEFIAAVQILVYIGAVGILLLFAIMLTERVTGDDDRRMTSRGWFWGVVIAVAVFFVLLLPPIQQWPAPETVPTPEPSVEKLGQRLMNPYVVTLEVLALLLTAALIAALAVVRRLVVNEVDGAPLALQFGDAALRLLVRREADARVPSDERELGDRAEATEVRAQRRLTAEVPRQGLRRVCHAMKVVQVDE